MLDAQPMQKPLNYARFVCFTTVFIGDEQKYENEQQKNNPNLFDDCTWTNRKYLLLLLFLLRSFYPFDLPKVKAFVYAAHRAIDIGLVYNVASDMFTEIYVCSIVFLRLLS